VDEPCGDNVEDVSVLVVLAGELDRAVQLNDRPAAAGVGDEIDADERGTGGASGRHRKLAR
jgi:hypothetical protein